MTTLALRIVGVLAVLAVLAGGSAAAPGSFPGQNGVIAFDGVVGKGPQGSVQVFQVSATGSGLKQLTNPANTAIWNQDPDYTANGAKIYLIATNRATQTPSRINSMNANGSGQKNIAAGVWPSINRSGSTLAVVQYVKGGQSVIARMTAAGKGRKIIGSATKKQGAGGPDYAPTGTRLAWYRVTYGKNGQGIAASDLFVRNGTHNTNITRRSSAKFYSPTWAPNGRKLVAIRGQRAIVSMNPNGTGVRVLTSVVRTAAHGRRRRGVLARRDEDRVPPVHGRLRRPLPAGAGIDLGHERQRLGEEADLQRQRPGPARGPAVLERLLDGREPLSTAPSRLRRLDLAVLRRSCRHERARAAG